MLRVDKPYFRASFAPITDISSADMKPPVSHFVNTAIVAL
jgi:hypothetical protein